MEAPVVDRGCWWSEELIGSGGLTGMGEVVILEKRDERKRFSPPTTKRLEPRQINSLRAIKSQTSRQQIMKEFRVMGEDSVENL